jgi:voltage-gated potassium channel
LAGPSQRRNRDGWRRSVYLALNPRGRPGLVSLVLIAIILASTLVAILETEDSLQGRWRLAFALLEAAFTAIFAAEYLLRLWSAPAGPRSRLRYALMPSSLIDLFVVVASLLPFVGPNLMVLRLVRVARMLRLAKIGRFSHAFATLDRALRARASHLVVTLAMAIVFLIFSATMMYWIEGEAQPAAFGSIPRAMWWATVTMTTVGYGDAVPLSVLGKLVAAVTSLAGIVLIAIPTGIFAAAFSDELLREAALAEAEAEAAAVASEDASG